MTELLEQAKKLYGRKKRLCQLKPGILVLFVFDNGFMATGANAVFISQLFSIPLTGKQDIEGEEEYIFLSEKQMFDLGYIIKNLPAFAVLDTRNEKYKGDEQSKWN